MPIVPIYLYGTQCTPQVGDGALYHYTKYDTFLKILNSSSLKSSQLCKMNDLNEADLSNLDWTRDFLMMWDAQNYIQTQCSLICFSQNYEVESVCREGANHPAMWSHYAENSNGVCLVFDRNDLIEINEDRLNKVFYKFEAIDYTWNHNPRVDICLEKYSNVSEFIHENYRELFYKKDLDWSNEWEVRLFAETPLLELHIIGAIKHIVLGKKLIEDKLRMRELLVKIASPESAYAGYFSLHSFATIIKSIGGYMVVDASHHIKHYLDEMIDEGIIIFNDLNNNWKF